MITIEGKILFLKIIIIMVGLLYVICTHQEMHQNWMSGEIW
jgi:hypothetical protein